MTEQRTITIKAHRCRDGKPTCSAEAGKADCQLLRFRMLGWPVCAWDGLDRDREGGDGYIRPGESCPVWTEKQA